MINQSIVQSGFIYSQYENKAHINNASVLINKKLILEQVSSSIAHRQAQIKGSPPKPAYAKHNLPNSNLQKLNKLACLYEISGEISRAKETLINSANEMKHEAHGTQQPRHINKIGEGASTAQRRDSLVQSINQRFPNAIDDLCQRVFERMRLAWATSGKIFPPVVVNGQNCGRVCLFYDESDFSEWKDGEGSIFLQNIVGNSGIWLARQHQVNHSSNPKKGISMIESMLDDHVSITITAKDGTIEYANNKFCEICKYTAEELIGRNIRMINSDYHSEEFIREMWRTISHGKIWKGEFRNRAKSGSIFWTNTTIIPILNSAGIPDRYTAIHTDITEYKEMKQRMEEKVTELARSNDELEQFAYVVTHDLQEPLRAISSFVQLLKRHCDHQLDDRANALISHVIDGTTRMQMLINDLLTYAQVNPSQTSTDIDCAQLLNYVLTDLSIAINESNATITYDKLPIVKGIPFQFTQLFYNLISNAIKFRGKRPPKIHIGVKEEPGEWIFFVTDNGIGMEEQYLERIFRVFQRLHSRREYAGTGIGLAICKKIVDHHKGRIWVNSAPNTGSEFYFTISKNL